ncbi:MAG: RadC family protein [Eubacteriaceae bacterium]
MKNISLQPGTNVKGESKQSQCIRECPAQERPQERMIASGPEALSDAELIGLIIRSGNRKMSAVGLGHEVLRVYGNDLKLFYNARIPELCSNDQLAGIGVAKACQIMAALELGKRVYENRDRSRREIISSADDAGHFLIERLSYKQQEEFCVMMLTAKNEIIDFVTVTKGTLTSSLVHPREVFSPAIRLHAAKIILAHNHPSGDPSPSREDRDVTLELYRSGELLQIPVLDHIIVGSGRFVSLKEQQVF